MNTTQLSVSAARLKLLANKHAPEILLIGGVTSVLTSTVLACKATMKAPAIISEGQALLKAIDLVAEAEEEPQDPKEIKKAKLMVSAEYGVGLARIYAPSVILMTVGIGMLVGSNRILSKRNAALLGAYKMVDEAFKRYRGRVREELGEDVDNYFRFKKRREGGMQLLDEKKKPINFDEIDNIDLPGELIDDERAMGIPSPYAVFFDKDSPQWRTDGTFNEFFLKAQQNYANQKLQMEGHVFLNEVYDMLGVDRTKEGAIVGWVKEHGDDFIDFDIYNPYNSPFGTGEGVATQDSLLLDFNVDGVIYDLI